MSYLLYVFLCIISILFFAAFGQTSITEDTIEEYMENIKQKIKRGEK